MKKHYEVSFKWAKDIYCTNIVHAESAKAVEEHYAKYSEVSVKEAKEYAIEDAQRKNMPIIEI